MVTDAQKLTMLKRVVWSVKRPLRLGLYGTGSVGMAVPDLLSGDLGRGLVKADICFAALALFEIAGSFWVGRRANK